MITLEDPLTIVAPQAVISPMRAAGLPPITTDLLPVAIGFGGCGPAVGGKAQICVSPTATAGRQLIMTLDTPGPAMTPG